MVDDSPTERIVTFYVEIPVPFGRGNVDLSDETLSVSRKEWIGR
jgi:hypothetical protein